MHNIPTSWLHLADIEFVWWGGGVVCKIIFMSNPTLGYVSLSWVVVELGFWQNLPLRMSGNLVNYLIFRQFLTFLQNWFWLSNLISECLHTLLISIKIFIKFLLLNKKWQRLQYCNFHQCQNIFLLWLDGITHMPKLSK